MFLLLATFAHDSVKSEWRNVWRTDRYVPCTFSSSLNILSGISIRALFPLLSGQLEKCRPGGEYIGFRSEARLSSVNAGVILAMVVTPRRSFNPCFVRDESVAFRNRKPGTQLGCHLRPLWSLDAACCSLCLQAKGAGDFYFLIWASQSPC